MPDKEDPKKKVGSWKLAPDVLAMLKAIADHDGESQATVLRQLIRKEAKRLKIDIPQPE